MSQDHVRVRHHQGGHRFLTPDELSLARDVFRNGGSLQVAATILKVDRAALDLALWRNLGKGRASA